MITGKLEQFRKRLGVSEGLFLVFLAVSVLWVTSCLLMLIPPVRSLVLGLGGFLLHRSFSVLHEKIIRWAVECLAAYTLFFFAFFHKKMFTDKSTGKKLYLFIIAVSAVVVFCVLFRANWTFGDDTQFVETTAVNKYFSLNPLSELGRFFPLGLFHYNIILFIFRIFGITSGVPFIVQFVFVTLIYIATVFFLYLLLRNSEPFDGSRHEALTVFFACTWFLFAKGFPRIYMEFVYPETVLIMLFVVFMFMYHKAIKTDKKRYFTAALLAAVYATYCKEPAFGVFVAVALINYIFNYRRQTKNEKIFHALLLVNGVLFLVLYYFLSFRTASQLFHEGKIITRGLQFFHFILANNVFFVIMIPLCFIRLFCILFKKDRARLYYDGLLFAGFGYGFAFVVLHLNSDWYFLPSAVLFLPALVYWTKYLYQKKIDRALLFFFLLILMNIYNIGSEVRLIKYVWGRREEFRPYIADLYSEYKAGKKFIWYESDDIETYPEIYKFTVSRKKDILNTFLNYLNKSEGKTFFTVSDDAAEIGADEDILLFYPLENSKYGPVPEVLQNELNKNHFELYKYPDYYATLIYRRKKDRAVR
jgi:hypothetical protein